MKEDDDAFPSRLLFGMLGVGILLPYSALISCDDFYIALHADVHDIAGQSTALNISALLITTLVLLFSIQTDARPIPRMLLGFGAILFLLLLLAAVPYPPVWLILLVSCVFGTMDAISQSGVYLLAAHYPPRTTAATTIGTALTGMVASLLRLWTRALFDSTTLAGLAASCQLLYAIAALIMALCCIAAIAVAKNHRARTRMGSAAASQQQQEESLDETAGGMADYENDNCDPPIRIKSMDIDTFDESIQSWHGGIAKHPRFGKYFIALQYTWKPTVSTFFNFFVTLSLFPGIVSSIQSSADSSLLGDWITVVLMTVFNVSDFIGRVIVGTERVTTHLLYQHERVSCRGEESSLNRRREAFFPHYNCIVWYQTWIRLVFFPLIVCCVYPTAAEPYISNDIVRCLIVFVMGLSNGFIVCANFVAVPEMAQPSNHRDAAQLLNLLALFGGLTAGSYSGLALDSILRSMPV